MKTLRYAHAFEVVSEMPEHQKALLKLAMNFRWTWHHETQDLFKEVDPQLWEQVEHNPIQLIRQLSPERVQKLGKDTLFLAKLRHCEEELDAYMGASTWFDEKHPGMREKALFAYFCAEFGLVESMPIYSGGLGLLAGDHLKAASDIGIPLVGVGLLYSRGYFRQYLTDDGWQQERYLSYDYYNYPCQPVRGTNDQPLRVTVDFPDRTVTVQVWKAQVGRVALYLLDSNLMSNAPADQGITDNLYGGDEHMRIRQEMVLGIGGMKALAAMGLKPTVCHMNEGHAAFLSVERIGQIMEEHNCDFRTARQITVAGNVFTTHTPVPAGFDVFRPELLKQYMATNVEDIGLDFADFTALGRIDPNNPSEPFNMAVLAMENANHVNGVSQLHAAVSRDMFQGRWNDFPVEEVPIEGVTNGVHTMTWLGPRMASLLDRHLGPAWREDPSDPQVWRAAAEIQDEDLWECLEDSRADLIRFTRRRLVKQLTRRNAGRGQLNEAAGVLDPRVLTIGFARRFATYKRGFLLFSDKERLKKIIHHSERPVQFLFAGKSHPKDDGGKHIIQDIFRFIQNEGGRARMVFLEDYDIEVARNMIHGVDVWLNNPRRPMEASGTSGMKVVPNGGLNCSILDGWWPEGYKPGTGWAIGDERIDPDQGRQDWNDSQALYQLLEQEIAPLFYTRNDQGIPAGWLQMVRASMRELAPRFSTARMVREYTQRFYVPAHNTFVALQEAKLKPAKEALEWRKRVRAAWGGTKVTEVADTLGGLTKVGDHFSINSTVDLNGLKPEDVRVQAIVGKVGPNRELLHPAILDMELKETLGKLHKFAIEIPTKHAGMHGYITRIVPFHETVHVASELALVRWQASD